MMTRRKQHFASPLVEPGLQEKPLSIALREIHSDLLEHSEPEVALVDIQGLAPAEAARVLGIPGGLARIRLHRARTALREALKTFGEDLS